MIRKAVRLFAEAMERRLIANDHKRSWGEIPFRDLLHLLEGEVRELWQAYENRSACDENRYQQVTKECADIANFAMMIAENYGAHPHKEARHEPTPTDNID